MSCCWRLFLVTLLALSGLPRLAAAQATIVDVAAYAQPDERVVSIQPALRYQGHTYSVHYFTAGSYSRQDAGFFIRASADYFESLQISGLLVTEDGERVVDDEATLRTVFTLYPSAYLLYALDSLASLDKIDDSFVDDLHNVTFNPLFLEQQIKALFSTRKDETAEALRGVLTAQVASSPAIVEFSGQVRAQVELGSTVIEAVDGTLEAARFSNQRGVRTVAKDIRKIFGSWQPVTEQATSFVELDGQRIEFFNALDVLSLGTRLVGLAELQRDRAEWLANYASFARGDAAPDWDQLAAAGMVVTEAHDNWTRRGSIILQFVRDNSRDLVLRKASDVLAKKWVSWSWNTFGKRTTGHLVAGAASAWLLGFTIGNLLYGLDDLFNNFKAGERADEMRHRFRSARRQLQSEAAALASGPYDGELASRFQAVYMLESLSAAQTYRSYADGVAATVREGLMELINPVSWFRGKEWRQAAQDIRDIADDVELEAERQVGHPDFIDTALTLVASRVPVISQPTPDIDLGAAFPTVSTLFDEAQQWLQGAMEELSSAALESWNRFWQEQMENLQDQVGQMLAGLAESVESWWRDFLAEQQRRLQEEMTKQVNEMAQQLCGAPLALVFGVATIGWRRRR